MRWRINGVVGRRTGLTPGLNNMLDLLYLVFVTSRSTTSTVRCVLCLLLCHVSCVIMRCYMLYCVVVCLSNYLSTTWHGMGYRIPNKWRKTSPVCRNFLPRLLEETRKATSMGRKTTNCIQTIHVEHIRKQQARLRRYGSSVCDFVFCFVLFVCFRVL